MYLTFNKLKSISKRALQHHAAKILSSPLVQHSVIYYVRSLSKTKSIPSTVNLGTPAYIWLESKANLVSNPFSISVIRNCNNPWHWTIVHWCSYHWGNKQLLLYDGMFSFHCQHLFHYSVFSIFLACCAGLVNLFW